jgi:predicted MPP superfamily phosphohydrolase
MSQLAEAETVEAPSSPEVTGRRRVARVLPMVIAMLSLMVFLHVYVGQHLFGSAVMPAWAGALGWLGLVTLFVLMPVSMFLRRRNRDGAARFLLPLTHYWMGTFAILFVVVLATDAARWAYLFLSAAQRASQLQQLARLQAMGIVGLTGALALLARRTALGRATVERVRIPIPGLGKGVSGLRIVQISDVHIGETLRRDFLERTVADVNALAPDIIAVTGDLVDGRVNELSDELSPLSQLKAKLGVFYVTGNHEYYWDGPAWVAEVRRLGLTVLHNEHRVLERGGDKIVLGGVPDVHGGDFVEGHAPRPDLAFAGAPQGVPRVLLAHQPLMAAEAAKAGVSLQLSGHTHGGQIFPFSLLVRLQQPVVQGLKKLHGLWVYAHRGTGFWGPAMRLGPSPEIAELELVAE